jgi:predicted phage-related endonuclease
MSETGASPDGLVGDDGLVEIKNPQTATHLETLLSGAIPKKYALQMQHQMSCTGRQWCDFVSFDSRLPPHLQLWVKRVERDQKMIDKIDGELEKFISEMLGKIEQLNERFPTGEAA